MASLQYFFPHVSILENFYSVHVILIPKVNNANRVEDFRLIALANFHFKTITRILTYRLSPIASDIISPHQYAFVKGMHIVDSPITTSECVNVLDTITYAGNMAIKFDIKVALDTLEWSFLLNALRAFAFGETFVEWIHEILCQDFYQSKWFSI